MIKVYFYDGGYKKVSVCTFLKWLKKCNLVIDEKRNIYYDGAYIGYYVNLSNNNNFGVLECILCLALLTLIILVLMKGGVIL